MMELVEGLLENKEEEEKTSHEKDVTKKREQEIERAKANAVRVAAMDSRQGRQMAIAVAGPVQNCKSARTRSAERSSSSERALTSSSEDEVIAPSRRYDLDSRLNLLKENQAQTMELRLARLQAKNKIQAEKLRLLECRQREQSDIRKRKVDALENQARDSELLKTAVMALIEGQQKLQQTFESYIQNKNQEK